MKEINTTLMNENASLITVFSLQLIVVLKDGHIGPIEFLISSFCFFYAWQAMHAEYLNAFSQLLIASIASFSVSYFVVVPLGYISYFAVNALFPYRTPLPSSSNYPITTSTFKVDLPGAFSHTFMFGEVVAFCLLLPIWLLIRRLIAKTHGERTIIVFQRSAKEKT